jgi:hypothetical protein
MPHTPGPWEARPNDGQIILNGSNCYNIQEIFNDAGGFNPADIRLMGAAPEMLAVCKRLARDLNMVLWKDGCGYTLCGSPAAIRDSLLDVIAKAEGRE